jgi:hypothetical protein
LSLDDVFCTFVAVAVVVVVVVVVVVDCRNSFVSLLIFEPMMLSPSLMMTTLMTVSNRQLIIVVIRLVSLELDSSSVLGVGEAVFGITDFE